MRPLWLFYLPWGVRAVGAVAMAVSAFLLLKWENLDWGIAVIGVAGWIAVFLLCGRRSRISVLALGLDLLLIFAYVWSMDEAVSVNIRWTRGGYIAKVGGNSVNLRLSSLHRSRQFIRGSHLGVYQAGPNRRAVTPLGGAKVPPHPSELTRLGEALRFAGPGPAWSDIRLVSHKTRDDISASPGSLSIGYRRWIRNPRGELQGPLDSYGLFRLRAQNHFLFSAQLHRSDGIEGVLVGVNTKGQGYLLGVSMDDRIARWYRWNRGPGQALARSHTFSVQMLPMVQRLLRALLPSVVLGLLLLGLMIPLYGVLTLAFAWIGNSVPRIQLPKINLILPSVWDVTALVATVASVVVTGWIAVNVYPGVPHVQDATAYLFQAKTLALGRLWTPVPRLPSFFTDYYVLLLHGHWFSKYPPGWPMLLALGVLVGKPWIVNPVLTGGCLFLLYLIGCELYSKGIALLAVLLAFSSPFVLFIGNSYYPEATTCLFLEIFVLAGNSLGKTPRWRRLYLPLTSPAGGTLSSTSRVHSGTWPS